MRVSKVKVKAQVNGQRKDQMVLMQRNTSRGSLIYEGNTSSDRTQEIIPDLKKESFVLSILNQTLISEKVLAKIFTKETSSEEKKEKWHKRNTLERFLRSYINSIILNRRQPDFPKTYLSESEIESFMNNRFRGSFEYTVAKQQLKAHLSKVLYQAFQEKDLTHLAPYAQWMKTYMESKSKHLTKSIVNNRIVIDGDPVVSTRMKALAEWTGQLDPKGQLDLSALHAKYETDLLAENLSKVDMKELGEDKLPLKKYEYHRELKLALQFHQKRIFGTKEKPNAENRNKENNKQLIVYNLEMVKYLERNFPIKTVKKYTRDDLTHYLKVDTIKQTIARQLENAVRASMLRQGKTLHHELNEETTSTNLTDIKREDSFVMNLITTSAFAANNIRNIVYDELTKDILGKDDFIIALGKNKVNWKRFHLFFGLNMENETEPKQQETLWALRGAVQQIRNNVNHYKKGAIAAVFGITDFQYDNNPKPSYSTTLFKDRFQAEIDALSQALATQLMTGGVLSFYSPEILQDILSKTEFQLCRSVIPFAPGFKKVMNAGIGYQNAKGNERFYDLGLEMYLANDKKHFSPEAWAARYFLLKLLYNNVFLPEFMEEKNSRAFADSVEWLLNKNRKQAADSKNEHAFAFAEVRPMNQGEKTVDYMAYIQSHTMLEQSKKEDAGKEQSKKKEADQDKAAINFQKFTLQLFSKAFDNFLRAGGYQSVNVPQPQLNPFDKKEVQTKRLVQLRQDITPYCKVEKGGIDSNKDEHIAFYVYCKLLDANHLSTLRNELIKYHSAANNDSLRHQVEVIELCLVSVDQIPNSHTELYDSPQACLQRLTPFLADGLDPTSCADLYVQSDKETPVVHRSIELSVKYGTQNLLQQLVEASPRFKVTQGNFEKWHKGQAEVESYLKRHQEYHDKWKKEKGKKAIEVREEIGVEYINNCILINNYNWNNNKVHFEHLKKLQSLTIEILGRMAGFIKLWERDFQYLDKLNAKKAGREALNFSGSLPKEKKFREHKAYFEQTFLSDEYKTVKDYRNFIAHFNYLTSMDRPKHSLLDLINILRKMLHYDRKLRNAVSQAIIKLFDKHGMKLELQFDSNDRSEHQLSIKQLVPKKLYHLATTEKTKDQPLYTNQVSPVYCDMCRALLEMKK